VREFFLEAECSNSKCKAYKRSDQSKAGRKKSEHPFNVFDFSFDLDFKIKKIKNRLALASPFINLSYIF